MNREKYAEDINKKLEVSYEVANKARAKGLDVVNRVEIPIARTMAERVVGLISSIFPKIKDTNVVERIEELEKEYGKLDWRVALKIAEEVAKGKFCKFEDIKQAMEIGIRFGIAYVTNGVVASPLEGFTGLEIRKRKDGKEYLAAFFSGPIRSAGGTGQGVSVLIADYVRSNMGYYVYDPTEEEIKRTYIELIDYHERITNLQYLPSKEEVEFMWRNLPIQLDGEPSEKLEVSNYKNLSRVSTNFLRSGFCLVIGEGLTQKAPKLWTKLSSWGKEFGMEQWNFLEKFIKLQKRMKALEEEEQESDEKIKPDYTYIKDMVAGRPVLGHPLRSGGLRIRYGKARNTSLSSCALSPATMVMTKDYIAIGTQLKLERPLKSTAVSSCDSIEGPIVKLKDGSVLMLNDYEEAKKYRDQVKEIIFLGDILVNYGDFYNWAHVLVPPGYCEEWWLQELKNKTKNVEDLAKTIGKDEDYCSKLLKDFTTKVDFSTALAISQNYKIPLHPRWTYHWKEIDLDMFKKILLWFNKIVVKDNKAILPLENYSNEEENPKRGLELIGLPHNVVPREYVVIEGDDAKAFVYILSNIKSTDFKEKDVLELINGNSEVKLRDKNGSFTGARMGRPEKAKMRKLKGTPHMLFPVGEEGGKLRSLKESITRGKVTSNFPSYKCLNCGFETIYPYCIKCGGKTEKTLKDNNTRFGHNQKELEINDYFNYALKRLGLREYPSLIKGVRGTSSTDHTPEDLTKGILRAMHDVYVNKDGTIRYDMTELIITAFTPKEIGTNIEKLKELGYEKDIDGKELENEDQILELMPQDVILPRSKESSDEGCDTVMFKVAAFIDDLLKKLYKEKPFYNLKNKKDLIGHLIVGLAPHISVGMIGRIIGFSDTMGFYAHPLFHCAVRRDADGDEVAIILLMDALLNFSRKYLPGHRGARQDTPLIITPIINPTEVDDMVFDVDIVKEYPLEFYEACQEYKMPWEFKIKRFNDILNNLGEGYNMNFTHPVSSINHGVKCSAYKSIPSMQDKVLGQIELARMIRAVDEADVARLVIDRHFMRDIKGNLRKFTTQQFRCVGCNEKYRRPPLVGACTKCGGRIIFTVSEGSVIKYLAPSISLAEKFKLTPYLRQSLDLVQGMIESVFGKEPEKQEGLGKWF